MDIFDDIRPLYDNEVKPVLDKLVADEDFIFAASRLIFSDITLSAPDLISIMKEKIQGVDSIAKVQDQIAVYFQNVINNSTDGFTHDGLQKLDLSQSHLFISNHRDISLDSALVNLALHYQGAKTARIVAGDNLKSTSAITDVMRLNKTFFVRRSVKGVKELVNALNQLSSYIRHSLTADNESVWIAQKEGRAKDGNDRTAPAIIKMLAMGRDKSISFQDHFSALNVVPVCISYEYDPCDVDKAEEIYQAQKGEYRKGVDEDILTLGKGLTQYKGRVHLQIGQVVEGEYATPAQLAELIDRQILTSYRFFPSNVVAYELLHGKGSLDDVTHIDIPGVSEEKRQEFMERMANVPEHLKDIVLSMYATPISNCLSYY